MKYDPVADENRRLRNAGIGLCITVACLLFMAVLSGWRHAAALREATRPIIINGCTIQSIRVTPYTAWPNKIPRRRQYKV